MGDLGITKFKIVPRDYEDRKLGTAVSTAAIYNAGTGTLATLYSDTKATSQANPITVDNGTIAFYGYMPSFDIVVTMVDGATITRAGVSATDTRLSIDSSVTQGVTVAGAGMETAQLVKTKSWTIGLPVNSTSVDYSFSADDSENPSADDGILINDVVPAYAKIIDMSFVTTESASNTITVSVGSTLLGAEYLADTDVTTLATILQYATNSLGKIAAVATVGDIHLTGDPTTGWHEYDTGLWRLTITYIDFGQLV